MRILITGCGGRHFLDTLLCFRKKGNFLMGVASSVSDYLIPLLDKYKEVPRSDDLKYIDTLLKICCDEKIDILVPTVDIELLKIASCRNLFEKIGTKVSVASAESLRTATDKGNFYNYLSSSGIPFAEFAVVDDEQSLQNAAYEIGYPNKPICVKVLNGAGSRGFRIIDENFDFRSNYIYEKPSSRYTTMNFFLKNIYEDGMKVAVQEFLSGDEYSIDLLADNGKSMVICGRRNPLVINSIPQKSIVERNAQAYFYAEKIVSDLKLDGNVGIDFIFKDNIPIPIEVNARITATVALFKEAGVNLPYLQIRRLNGENIDSIPPLRYGLTMVKEQTSRFFMEE